jgi:2-oxo-4-hydroxy-4-carboxy-5-ureidoimidazoline decarboxylase
MTDVLRRWNGLPVDAAAREVLPCCGSTAWAQKMAEHRPLRGEADVLKAASEIWRDLPEEGWLEAFLNHPRIGEKHSRVAAPARSAAWSGEEQSTAMGNGDASKAALRLANERYERRFGRIFLICARGRTAEEILSNLEARMANDDETELLEAAEQQRQITAMRLQRWMEGA